MLATPVLAATTIQQDFDAAQVLLDAGKTAEARTAFTALLSRFSPTSQGKAASLVRARLGNALLASGEAEQAEPILFAALAGLKGTTPQDIEERGVALYDLGRARELLGALDSAAEAYREAIASGAFTAASLNDIGARAALARAVIWSNPDESRTLLDALLALPPETFGKSRDQRALLQTLRGRVELNANNPAEAKRWFTMAARTAGGAETQSVSLADVRIRGDLALANFKLGNMGEVQKYIAFSGAGALVSEGLTSAADTPLPACAPASGLASDAVVVVEFAIGVDGRVSGVTPIYASRGSAGAAATARDDGPEVLFPQAVRRWFWRPVDVARLDTFWRQAVRVELRCFTQRSGGDPVQRSINGDLARWAAAAGVNGVFGIAGNDAATLPQIRAELARREAANGAISPQLIAPLNLLANNNAAPTAERTGAAKRATALLVAAGAPAAVVVRSRLDEIDLASGVAGTRDGRALVARDALLPLLAEQEAAGTGETRHAMFTRLRLAEAHDNLRATAASRMLLDRIIAAPESLLPGDDPIRTAALLHLSNQAAAAKDVAAAASALSATGLSAEQCSLIDIRPQAVNASIGSNAFPDEARRWSTGGFARVGYDITADGKPINLRTIVASPPFIFGPSTEKAVARFQYRPVFRPGNTIGCTGTTQSVHYRIAS
ncbi:MAG: energy transducer TonB [Polymorphobacter sp.]